MSKSQDLDKTLPDRWRRWVHNPEWDKATHECLNSTCSGTVTKSEVDVQLNLKADDYRDSLAYAAQMVSVLAKQRWPRRSLWQRICGWLRYQFRL